MDGAEKHLFRPGFGDASEPEPAEASGFLDMSEDGSDDLLPQPLTVPVSGLSQSFAHGLDFRTGLLVLPAVLVLLAAGVGPNPVHQGDQFPPGRWHSRSAIGRRLPDGPSTAAWAL